MHEHERLHTSALNKAYDLIKMSSEYAEVYCLVGNHDLINNRQFLTKNHWMNAMKEWPRVTIVDYPIYVEMDGFSFSAVPYVPPGSFMDALNFIPRWKDSDVIFAHQEIKGCKMGAIISEEGDEWLDGYPFLVSGHKSRGSSLSEAAKASPLTESSPGPPDPLLGRPKKSCRRPRPKNSYRYYYSKYCFKRS